jgi:molybdopterin-guanine dinucleotide biosynthesis protein A
VTLAPAVVVVLTGGTSRRMGGVDKTALDVGGRPVLDRLLTELADLPVVVVGAPRAVPRTVLWAREEPPGGGPFAGVAAGVVVALAAHPTTQVVVVVAGDQPFAGEAVPSLRAAVGRPDAEAAVATGPDGRPQPLLAAYRLAAVRDRLDDAPHGRPARHLLTGLRTVAVSVDPRTTLDVDDPADLTAARDAALRPGSAPTP